MMPLSEGRTAAAYFVASRRLRCPASSMVRRHSGMPTAQGAPAPQPQQPLYRGMFDVDANLTHPDLARALGEHLERAAAVGVTRMLVPGASLEDSRAALMLAQNNGGFGADAAQRPIVELFGTAGVHPYNVPEGSDNLDVDVAELRRLASNERCIAIGECGLDFSEGFPSRDAQLRWFEPQVRLACELQCPLFLHEREAHDDFLAVLERYRPELPPLLVHCFSGTAAELSAYLALPRCSVSFSGLLCKPKRGAMLRGVVRELAPQLRGRVMVETDAPYLGFPGCRTGYTTRPKKQSPNVPSALPRVVAELASCLGRSEEEVARETASQATAFFGLRAD